MPRKPAFVESEHPRTQSGRFANKPKPTQPPPPASARRSPEPDDDSVIADAAREKMNDLADSAIEDIKQIDPEPEKMYAAMRRDFANRLEVEKTAREALTQIVDESLRLKVYNGHVIAMQDVAKARERWERAMQKKRKSASDGRLTGISVMVGQGLNEDRRAAIEDGRDAKWEWERGRHADLYKAAGTPGFGLEMEELWNLQSALDECDRHSEIHGPVDDETLRALVSEFEMQLRPHVPEKKPKDNYYKPLREAIASKSVTQWTTTLKRLPLKRFSDHDNEEEADLIVRMGLNLRAAGPSGPHGAWE